MDAHDPTNPQEWQQAVNAAAGMRAIEDCRMYGLIVGGPAVNTERCDWLLDEGARRGFTPSKPAGELAGEIIETLNGNETPVHA